MKSGILWFVTFAVVGLQSQGARAGALVPLLKIETRESLDNVLSLTLKNISQSQLGKKLPLVLRNELGDLLSNASTSAWGKRYDVKSFMQTVLKGKCGANGSCQIGFDMGPGGVDTFLDGIGRQLNAAKVGDKTLNGQTLSQADVDARLIAARKLNEEPANFKTLDKLVNLKCPG